jgi:hypothetical protein
LYSSSLYSQYGDVNYPFNPQFGDKIVIGDATGVVQEVDVVTTVAGSGTLSVIVTPQVLDDWSTNPNRITTFLLLRKYADEQPPIPAPIMAILIILFCFSLELELFKSNSLSLSDKMRPYEDMMPSRLEKVLALFVFEADNVDVNRLTFFIQFSCF